MKDGDAHPRRTETLRTRDNSVKKFRGRDGNALTDTDMGTVTSEATRLAKTVSIQNPLSENIFRPVGSTFVYL